MGQNHPYTHIPPQNYQGMQPQYRTGFNHQYSQHHHLNPMMNTQRAWGPRPPSHQYGPFHGQQPYGDFHSNSTWPGQQQDMARPPFDQWQEEMPKSSMYCDKGDSGQKSTTPSTSTPHQTFTKSTMKIKKEEKPEEEELTSEDDTDEANKGCSVEVTGFDSIDLETLELYFESKRSGGGQIEGVILKGEKTLIITFQDAEVQRRVLEQKSHIVNKVALKVKDAVVLPRDGKSFLLEGLREDTTREDLDLLLGSCTDMEEDPLFLFGEKRGVVLVRYPVEITGFEKMCEKLSKKKYKQLSLIAKPVLMTNCLLVKNLPQGSTKNLVTLYFESSKRSGGGEIDDVKIDDERNSATVYFTDYNVVDSVLMRKHEINDTPVEVQPFHDCIGYVVSMEEPIPSFPERFSMEVEQQLLTFFCSKEGLLEKLRKEVSNVHGELMIEENGRMVVNHTLSAKTPNVHQVVKNWSKDVETCLNDNFKQFKAVSIQVPEGIWLLVQNQLFEIDEGEMKVHLEEESTSISFTGLKQDADNLEKAIHSIIDKIEAEREKQRRMTTVPVPLDDSQIKQLRMCKFVKQAEERYPETTIKIIAEESKIAIHGQEHDISAVKLFMYETLQELHKTKVKLQTESLQEFWKSPAVSSKIYGIFKEKNVEAAFNLEGNDEIVCAAQKKGDMQMAVDILQKSIIEVSIKADPKSEDVFQQGGWTDLLAKLQEDNMARIEVSGLEVRVTGFDAIIQDIKTKLEEFIKMNTFIDYNIQSESGRLKFISRFQKGYLDKLQNGRLRPVEIKIRRKGDSGAIIMRGTQDDMNIVIPQIKRLVDGIQCHKHGIDKPGMSKVLHKEDGLEFLKRTETEVPCIIEGISLEEVSVEETEETLSESHTYTTYDDDDDGDDFMATSDYVPDTTVMAMDLGHQPPLLQPSSTQFTTAELKLIKLVMGNISSQKADIIVNTIQTSCDLNTGVISKAILSVAGPQLLDYMNQSKPSTVNEGDLIRTIGGKLACQLVYHICILGTHWNDGTTAEPLLRSVLQKCFETATKDKKTSIAIPAIGTGGLGYPKNTTARIMYDEAKQFSAKYPNSSLTHINVVVYDKDTCKAFEDEMIKLNTSRKSPQVHTHGHPKRMHASTPVSLDVTDATSFKTTEGILVKIVKGNIADQKADVIINTIQTSCDLSTGVIAQAIGKAAGDSLKQDMLQKKPSSVNEGDLIVTIGGNLSCKHVYHLCILGTKWDGGQKVGPFLRSVIQKIMKTAHSANMTSIAIPALGTGGLNYPRDVVANIIYEEATSFRKNNHKSSLNKIKVVVYDKDTHTIKAFEDEMKRFKSALYGVAGPSATTSASIGSTIVSVSGNSYKTKEGLTVTLVKGDVVKEKVDVIVNPIQSSCDLSQGVLSKTILQVAGPQLQTEINKKKTANVNEGDMISTRGGKLKSKEVYHVSILGTHWDGGTVCDPLMRGVIKKCLDSADKSKLKSIAIPAMGTGGLKYPNDITAKIMYEEANKFSANMPMGNLCEIRIVVYDKNQQACKVFEDEMKKMTSTVSGALPAPIKISKKEKMMKSKRHVTKRSLYTDLAGDGADRQMLIGSIRLKVYQGDITDEATDAIVNSTNKELDLGRGGHIQVAILKAAGDSILIECKRLGKQKPGSVVITSAGNLKCRKIIHVILKSENFENVLVKVLRCAEKNGMQSIALPMLGTGQYEISLKKVATKILEAIGTFSLGYTPQTLKEIRAVIFKPEGVDVFHKAMKDFLDKPIVETKTWTKKLTGAVSSLMSTSILGAMMPDELAISDDEEYDDEAVSNPPKPSSLSLNIFTDAKDGIGTVVRKINKFIDREYKEMSVPLSQELVNQMSSDDFKYIESYAYQRQTEVKLVKTSTPCTITIKGSYLDVVNVQHKVTDILNHITLRIADEKMQKALAQNVKWLFEEEDGSFEAYDEDISGRIEMAYQDKRPTVDFELDGGKYRIDLGRNVEIDLHNPTSEAKVKRQLKEKGIQLPDFWKPMPENKAYEMVTLDAKSPEHQEVEKFFRKTYTPKKVVQIRRIQNPGLYRSYVVLKQNMDAKNPPKTENERLLFHGTSADTIDNINAGGFNRSFAGKNATAYGKGTYFAVQASYSAGGYAAPDSSGVMHMYRAKVLTGEYTLGNKSMVVPPSKNPNDPTDCFDSVVNNMSSPIMFVVFQDAMAYPEYLISFQ
ncbi:protein mono-ADP-ribosyltransferase PARP14-like isoform X2 [Glandiceps talaboti]